MKAKIQKWGNSFGVRIPKDIVVLAHLDLGAEVEIQVENGDIIMRLVSKKKKTLESIVKSLKASDAKYGEMDWGGPVGKEEW